MGAGSAAAGAPIPADPNDHPASNKAMMSSNVMFEKFKNAIASKNGRPCAKGGKRWAMDFVVWIADIRWSMS